MTMSTPFGALQQVDAGLLSFSGRYEHRVIEGGVGHNLPPGGPPGLRPGGHRRRRLL